MLVEERSHSHQLTKPMVMGVLNLTPDSFSDAGKYLDPSSAVDRALEMEQQGADIIDLGGESTRPGASSVSTQEELDRVLPVLSMLRESSDVPVSIDTSKLEVMTAACEYGVTMINDVRALRKVSELGRVAQLDTDVCLMYMPGTDPKTMQDNPRYNDVVAQVLNFLKDAANRCIRSDIKASRIWIDPGFGFGKTAAHNCKLLNSLADFVALGYPVLVGLSRKSMIGHFLGLDVDERVQASVGLAAMAYERGARMVRVHDVLETRQALDMIHAVKKTVRE